LGFVVMAKDQMIEAGVFDTPELTTPANCHLAPAAAAAVVVTQPLLSAPRLAVKSLA